MVHQCSECCVYMENMTLLLGSSMHNPYCSEVHLLNQQYLQSRPPMSHLKYSLWWDLERKKEKKCLRETLNLMACVDSSTHTKMNRNRQKDSPPKKINKIKSHLRVWCQMSHVMCQKSYVRCHMLCVTYHMSPVTNANSHSHIPSPC